MYFELKRVTKNQEYRWQEVEERPDGAPSWKDAVGNEFWAGEEMARIAFIGHGSAVAYYLTALEQVSVVGKQAQADVYGRMIVFGAVDPWDQTVRGEGYINHESHQISHWAKTVPEFSKSYMRRSEFAKQNAAAFQTAFDRGARNVRDPVIKIEKVGDVFRITTTQGEYPAAFVVVATGLGAHRELGDPICPKLPKDDRADMTIPQMKEALVGQVVNLDTFMTQFAETEKMRGNPQHRETPKAPLTIAVHGTNAGIDAVQRAWQLGHKVLWIEGRTAPVFLPGHRLPIEQPQVDIQRVKIDRAPVTVEPKEGKVLIKTHQDEKAPVELGLVDYYVIALGQDPFGERHAGDLLLQKGNLAVKDLEPIYDWNQHFGMPFETVLGFQTKGTRLGMGMGMGLIVIGGVAESLSKDPRFKVAHNFAEQMGPADPKPTLESCQAQLDKWPSLRKKYTTAQNLLNERLPNWERARRHRDSLLELAGEYLGRMEMLQLLSHQIDPTAVPKDLEEMLARYDYTQLDWFQKWQVAKAKQPAATAVASVLLPSQLGAVRAVVAALTTMIPDYIQGGDSNFNTDDRTMLAVHLAKNFPKLSESTANDYVEAILRLRRGEDSPLGFFSDGGRKLIQDLWRQKQ